MNYICKCGSENMKVANAKPPHLASLICSDCEKWQKFLSRPELQAFRHHEYEQALECNREDNRQLKLW